MDESATASIASNSRPVHGFGRSRRLILMTRVPEVGRVKTRLIPSIGPEGAALVHTALLQRTLRVTAEHARKAGVDVEVRFTGEAPKSRVSDLHETVWREQEGQDLGERIHNAITAALNEGAQAVIVIGTDCPELSHDVLDRAWRSLETHDLVLGPADDGGYYLIGMSQPNRRLFEEINWGTEVVLRQTQDRAKELRESVGFLPVLSDVDEAENLVLCRRYEDDFEDCLPKLTPGLLTVVIPTLNEVIRLEETLKPILSSSNVEVIIADGGSSDGTIELAERLGCRVVSANRGRGRQMNAGAAQACGEFLLFLHADTRLPEAFRDEILHTLNSGAIAGAFRFLIDYPGWSMRVVEWGTNLRSKYLQLPYGDQGLFLRSSDFFQIGGFKNWPLMEDVEMCRRLKSLGRIVLASLPAATSGRRWKRLGAFRNTIYNHVCMALYLLGVSPKQLAKFYYRNSQ